MIWKIALRYVVALLLAVALSWFFYRDIKIFLLITALFTVSHSISGQVRHGLQRLFVIAFFILIFMMLRPAFNMMNLYEALREALFGAFVGILTSLFVLPRHEDAEFRYAASLILQAESEYLQTIVDLFFKKDSAEKNALAKKYYLMRVLSKFSPMWIYHKGYNSELRIGHRHFLIVIERIEQILFSMHYAARQTFEGVVLFEWEQPFHQFVEQAQQLISIIIETLRLHPSSNRVSDLYEELVQLENHFKKLHAPHFASEESGNYILLAGLMADLIDLRAALIRLAESLRK